MDHKPVHINKWLLPFSWLYGFVVFIRNKFFKWGILKQRSFDIPVISVGNLTVGGTGKTPHIEYLVDLLKDEFRVAVLSRGYKRKTSGFVLATSESNSKEIGDEPLQIKQKFPKVIVAVDENRCRGIDKLLALPEKEKPQVILLDDGFQHRYVKPSLSILLTDFNRPFFEDKLLPAGRLREPASYSELANMILVTKCPEDLKPIDLRILTHEVNPFPYQDLLYTTLAYKQLVPVFKHNLPKINLSALKNKEVLLVAGIASPDLLVEKIKVNSKKLETMIFPDHHNFSKKDISDINNKLKKLNESERIVVVTEKDAVRLISLSKQISDEVKICLYSLPIEVSFVAEEDQEMFNTKIIEHVRKNPRDSSLY